MNSNPSPTGSSEHVKQGHSSRISFALILLMGLVVIVIGFWYLRGTFQTGGPTESKVVEPSGTIFLDLASPGSPFPAVHRFNVESGELTPIVLTDLSFVLNPSFYGSSYDSERAFIGQSVGEESPFFQVHIEALDDTDHVITNSETYDKRTPEWSPDGTQIAFTARTSLDTDPQVAENWGIYTTDLEGNEERVADGSYPKWSPDGKQLLFIRNDGIYTINLETKELTKRWGISDGSASLSMKIDVSRDGKYFAWSAPSTGKLVLAVIDGWDPFNSTTIYTIAASAFWPVFSPDSNFLTFVQIDVAENDSALLATNPRLVIYNLQTQELRTVLDLSDYNVSSMFISDWVYNQ